MNEKIKKKYAIKILKQKMLDLYGSLNNSDFWYRDSDITNTITSTANLTIGIMKEKFTTERLLQDYKFIQTATDSIIFSTSSNKQNIEEEVGKMIKELEENTKVYNKIKATLEEYDYCLSFATNKYCLVKGDKFIFKGFSKNIFFELVLKLAVKKIIKDDFINIEQFKQTVYQKFIKLPIAEISDYYKVNQLSNSDETKISDATRAALYTNKLIEFFDIEEEFIKEKESVKILRIKEIKNESIKEIFSETKKPFVIAYKHYIPKQILECFEIDWGKQFEALFSNLFTNIDKLFNIND